MYRPKMPDSLSENDEASGSVGVPYRFVGLPLWFSGCPLQLSFSFSFSTARIAVELPFTCSVWQKKKKKSCTVFSEP